MQKMPNHLKEWTALNKTLKAYTICGVLSAIVTLAALGFVYRITTMPPVVVVISGKKKLYLTSVRERQKITEEDIKSFLKEFIHRCYAWDNLNKEKILKEISPFATKGAALKIVKSLKRKKGIRQTPVNINVTIAKKGARVLFDTVLTIKGIPFVTANVLFVRLTKGTKTRLNPLGIYVAGVTVYAGKSGKEGP